LKIIKKASLKSLIVIM